MWPEPARRIQAGHFPGSFFPTPSREAELPLRGPFAIGRRTPLRLSKNKIEYLSDKILKMLQEHPRVHLAANTDLVARCIDDAIFHNMELEEEIDAEVEAHIADNVNEIRAMDMDVGALRTKIKRELARKRGFTL
jgi:hypothetical protein